MENRRTESSQIMEELVRQARERKLLSERAVRELLVISPLDKPVLEKDKTYYMTEPIVGSDARGEWTPVASQLLGYLGFNNAETDPPGTPAAHLFSSRLSRDAPVFRLSSQRFRQLCEERKVFVVTGKAVRTAPAVPAAPAGQAAPVPPASPGAAPNSLAATAAVTDGGSDFPPLPVGEDPGFAAVIQALGSTTLQYQTEERVSFQSVITDILQAQRVFNTLGDLQQSLGIVQAAMVAFDSKVSQWEYRFTDFFQRNRPETVGMTTINSLKAQQSKGRTHLGSARYQFRKLLSNLEQAKTQAE
ncbi:MAG: hypothetical protein FJ295_11810 [Planctomycetes bacterium]|nr:hypothetical protein [Planctomycetota bacterium]